MRGLTAAGAALATFLALPLACYAQCDPLNARRSLAAVRNYILVRNAAQAEADLMQVERACAANAGIIREAGELRRHLASDSPGSPAPQVALAKVSPYVANKYALVVGIGEYDSAEISSLRFAAKDAHDFRAMLVDPAVGRFIDSPRYVRLLTGRDATTRNIRIHLDEIAKEAVPEDLVVFFLSTHGTDARSENVNDAGRLGYIVTHDTRPGQLYATALPMVELSNWLKRLRAARVIGFLDTCYAGGVMGRPGGTKDGSRGGISEDELRAAVEGAPKSLLLEQPAGGLPPSRRRAPQEPGRVIISSSRADQLSWESPELDGRRGNSYFTRGLVDAFRNLSTGDSMPEIQQVYRAIERTVPAAVKSRHGVDQTPQMFAGGRVPRLVLGSPID
jgi:uncharacterized caspase-like protein